MGGHCQGFSRGLFAEPLPGRPTKRVSAVSCNFHTMHCPWYGARVLLAVSTRLECCDYLNPLTHCWRKVQCRDGFVCVRCTTWCDVMFACCTAFPAEREGCCLSERPLSRVQHTNHGTCGSAAVRSPAPVRVTALSWLLLSCILHRQGVPYETEHRCTYSAVTSCGGLLMLLPASSASTFVTQTMRACSPCC